MAVHKIKDFRSTTVVADKANDTWLVTTTGKIDTMDIGIDAGSSAKGREIIVEGSVSGADFGIIFGEQGGKGGGLIEIAKGGTVQSDDTAILSRGNNQDIVNKGTIGGVEGIISKALHLDVVNNGKFETSNTAVMIEDGGGRIVNNGKMFGEAAVYVADTAGTAGVTVINNGLMDTTKISVQLLSDGNHLIVNTGTITGGVTAGDGNDRFINRGGKVSEAIDLGDGNDTYIVDRTSLDIDEGASTGKDTVKASVDFTIDDGIEKLILTGAKHIDGTGNSENNRLFGNAGNNHLDGWGGDDLLKGGDGHDVFVFSYHGASDEILDFTNGVDRIDMRGWDGQGLENFADVKAHATKMGNDLLIDGGGGDDLLIHDFAKADLDKHDFIF